MWLATCGSYYSATARAVMHVGIASMQWQGKRSRHSQRMRNAHFSISGKRPMGTPVVRSSPEWVCILESTSDSEYKLTRMNFVSHGYPWWSVYPHNNFSCDKCAKNIGNHLQIVGNHGQSLTITAEFGRITNLWLTQGTISSSKGCHALISPQCNALFTSIRNVTIRVIPQHYRPFMCDIT